ncbi:MAG: hormogonium polysaccharide secretion pseudopilin HpsB, partial [Trichodesmium sp. MAG_R01]|nr:hormogonium polysaccharide secretion pseudopilin HpsB [Trichodesmium sp. MAG_R01]
MNKQQTQQKILKWQQTNPNSGYTILEGLVAMVLVATTMSAIAPVVALSVGTRVQARRVELAAQAARSYIDTLRSGGEKDIPVLLPAPIRKGQPSAPTGESPVCNKGGSFCGKEEKDPKGSERQFFCVNGDDEEGCQLYSLTDMIIQTGRYHPTADNPDLGYQLLVRVYRADSFQETSLCPGGANCPKEEEK